MESDVQEMGWEDALRMARQDVAHDIEHLQAEIKRLHNLLADHAEDALDDVTHWASYAGDYFTEKWALTDDVAKWERRRDLNRAWRDERRA
jgi:hypothetical protein